MAHDGTYLGRVGSEYDAESIFNQYGNHGSQYSATSIWNQYGSYGGEYSALSAFNQYTNTPPSLIKNGSKIGHLSVNQFIANAVNPYALKACKFY